MSDEYDVEETGPRISQAEVDFLQQKGALEVIVVAGTGARFKELVDKVDLSSATLTRRLNTARRYNLLEKEQRTDSDGNVSQVYTVTGAGYELYVAARRIGFRDTLRHLRETKRELEDQREEVLEAAEEGYDKVRDLAQPPRDRTRSSPPTTHADQDESDQP